MSAGDDELGLDLDAPPPAARYAALEAGHRILTELDPNAHAGAAIRLARSEWADDLAGLEDDLARHLTEGGELTAGVTAVVNGLLALGALTGSLILCNASTDAVADTLALELAVRTSPPAGQ